MDETNLKKYWRAYTDAWGLMKNYCIVNQEHIASKVQQQNIYNMKRLYCLVVWSEIKRINEGGEPLEKEQYRKAFTSAWHLFKEFSNPNDNDLFWETLVEQMYSLESEYNYSEFIINLLVHVTLEEIEHLYNVSK